MRFRVRLYYKEYEVGHGTLVGRHDDCDVQILIPDVSRRHFRFAVSEKGELYVEDMGSYHGTYVNGERARSYKVLTGDIIKFGSAHMTVLGPVDDQTAVANPEELAESN